MKQSFSFLLVALVLLFPLLSVAQVDTSAAKKDTSKNMAIDTSMRHHIDTVVKHEDTVVAVPPNCYKQWTDLFAMRGAEPVTDGMQDVVIAFKIADNYNCFLGRVQVVGGKIKAPLYVQ